jgi:hypothetical protein
MKLIETSMADHVGSIAFDHDSKGNALGAGLIAETIAVLDKCRADGARVAVLRTRSGPASIAASKEAIHVLSEAVAISPATYEYLHGLRRQVYFGADYQGASRPSCRSGRRGSRIRALGPRRSF